MHVSSSLPPTDSDSVKLIFNNSEGKSYNRVFNSRFRWLKHMCLGGYKTAMMIKTMWNAYKTPSVPISQQAPYFQNFCEKVAHKLGLNPSYPYITELHFLDKPWTMTEIRIPCTNFKVKIPILKIPVCTAHVTNDQYLNKAVLEPHRMVNFMGGRSFQVLFGVLQEVFPISESNPHGFDQERTLFTCGENFTQQAHASIAHAFKEAKFDDIIAVEGEKLITRWKGYEKKNKSFDLSKETRLYTSSVITQGILGGSERCEELSEAVYFINSYLFAKAISKASIIDKERYDKSCVTFREIINEILEREKRVPLPIFQQNLTTGGAYTLADKKALCLSLFFAGQETTAFSLDNCLSYLALNADEQNEMCGVVYNQLRNLTPETGEDPIKKIDFSKVSNMKKFINERLLAIPPVYGLSKRLKNDAHLSFSVGDGPIIGKYMRKNEALSANIMASAKQVISQKMNHPVKDANYDLQANIFGGMKKDAHICLGRQLALKEISQLTARILPKFKILTDETSFKYTPQVTNQAEPFQIRVQSRQV